MNILINTLLTGIGATAVADLWSLARKALLGTPPPDFGLVGRWIGHMPRGTFQHEKISAAAPIRGEALIGWSAHYLTGIAFAGLLPLIAGPQWFEHPSLASALLTGIATVLAPFLIMQPGMGAGLAASRTPRPNAARIQSLITHFFFGVGLYVSALCIHQFT